MDKARKRKRCKKLHFLEKKALLPNQSSRVREFIKGGTGSGYGTVKTVPLFCGDGTVNMYTSRLLLMVPPVAGSEDEPWTLTLELTVILTLFLAVTGTKFLKENKNE